MLNYGNALESQTKIPVRVTRINLFPPAALLAALLGPAGCSSPVKTTGKVLTKTVTTAGSVAGKTAVATVKTGGKVAGTALTTTGSVAKSVATSAVQTAMVTVKDAATGVAKQIPWTEGMKLYAASKTAEFSTYLKAFEIVSGAKTIRTDWKKIKAGAPEPVLKPGDIVTIRPAR